MDANSDCNAPNNQVTKFMSKTHLIYPLTILHPSATDTPTHSRGRKRIDTIIVTPTLLRHIDHIHILPFDPILFSDHRPILLTMNQTSLFGYWDLPHPPSSRRLITTNTKRHKKYTTYLEYQLTHHNISKRVTKLHEDFTLSSSNTSPKLIQKYELLSTEITSLQLRAERKCRKNTNGYPWSPQLQHAWHTVHIWRVIQRWY